MSVPAAKDVGQPLASEFKHKSTPTRSWKALFQSGVDGLPKFHQTGTLNQA